MWDIYPEIMDRTCRHKFRYDDCVNQWLLCAWNMISGHFQPTNEKRNGVFIGLEKSNIDSVCQLIKNNSKPQICISINVPDDDDDGFNRCVSALEKAFGEILPQKSSFEK